jgi:hypothetical protein
VPMSMIIRAGMRWSEASRPESTATTLNGEPPTAGSGGYGCAPSSLAAPAPILYLTPRERR